MVLSTRSPISTGGLIMLRGSLRMVRICTTCRVEKPIEEFYRNKAQLGGREYLCKECSKSRHRTAEYRKNAAQSVRRHAIKHRDRVHQLKRDLGPCCNPACREENPVCLDFHHVRFPKVGRIDRVLSYERLVDEAAKCVLLCKNCHAKEHAGMLKLKLKPFTKRQIRKFLQPYGRKFSDQA
jgi:hypothetical protein